MGQVLEIRDGRKEDGAFIAANIFASVGYEMFPPKDTHVLGMMPLMSEICSRTDTLYAYDRTRVACVGGRPVGSLTAYPSDGYLTLRNFTWGMFGDRVISPDIVGDVECQPGEFYLDSMAVLPEFRHKEFEYKGRVDRIGHLLMLDGIEKGWEKGFKLFSLIVEKEKPRLKAYYASLGFIPDGEITFFGEPYVRMILSI